MTASFGEIRRHRVLRLLSSGDLVRGTDIAETLGVSVRSVYRDVEALRDDGYDVRGGRGCGYMLRRPGCCPTCGGTLPVKEGDLQWP